MHEPPAQETCGNQQEAEGKRDRVVPATCPSSLRCRWTPGAGRIPLIPAHVSEVAHQTAAVIVVGGGTAHDPELTCKLVALGSGEVVVEAVTGSALAPATATALKDEVVRTPKASSSTCSQSTRRATFTSLSSSRDRTTREVIAQVLDYGSRVTTLDRGGVLAIAKEHLGRPFEDVFRLHRRMRSTVSSN